MKTYHAYSQETGLFSNQILSCSDDFVDMNIPEGCSCLLGSYDPLREKVNILTGEVEAYQPPSPGPNYTWDIPSLTWVYVPTDDDLALQARKKRDALLTACDWVTLRAFRTQTPIPTDWLEYQTALADLPAQAGFPRDIIWPTAPTN